MLYPCLSLPLRVSLRDLWKRLSCNFERDLFVIVIGYIDESYSGEIEPLTFDLSCCFTTGSEWFWIENAWRKVLEKKNKELTAAGRTPIKRFHARDLNSFIGEFKGWDGPERTAFTEQLIAKAFSRHVMNSIGFVINLKELGNLWPSMQQYTKAFAYDVILRLIMSELAREVPKLWGTGTRITLIHERCAYDGILLSAFNRWLRQKPLRAGLFTSIAPMGWETCIPLQPADFVANESMKEVHRTRPGQKQRERRKSLSAFINHGGGGSKCFVLTGQGISDLKKMVDNKTLAQMKAAADTANGK